MDDDSLSRRAADITADLNHQAAVDRLQQSTWPQHGGTRPMSAGSGGGSNIGIGGAVLIVLVVSAIAGGFGGADWFLSSLMFTGGIVVFVAAVAALTGLSKQGLDASVERATRVKGGALAFLARVTLGAVIGTAAGAMVPTLLGDDIPMRDGMLTMAAVGAVIGAIAGLIGVVRRR